MKIYRSFLKILAISVAIATLTVLVHVSSARRQKPNESTSREDAYRANNLGVALMEQFNYKKAAESFRRALEIDPKLNLARINLSIALYNVPDLPGSQKEAQTAIAASSDAPQPFYIQGLIAKSQNRSDEALAAFQHVIKLDPNDVGANINMGQIYAQQRKYPEAIASFNVALAAEPYNGTALYNLGTALMRSNKRDEGQRVITRFTELRQRGSGTTLGQGYLEQGRYADAVASTGAEPELVDKATPAVSLVDAPDSIPALKGSSSEAFTPALGRRFKSGEWKESSKSEIAGGLGGCTTLFDFDGDGNLDLFWASASGLRLYHNSNGKFVDVTEASGALNSKQTGIPIAAVAGDYDNDGKADLFVVSDNGLALYHNDGGGKFSNVTAAAGIPKYPYLASSVAFVDVDHDGDLDIFVAGLADLSKAPKGGEASFPSDFAGAPSLLLRNDGNGKFTDISATAKINTEGHAVAVVPTDFNNRRDIDLLVVNYGKSPDLYSNQRDGTFRNVSADVGLNLDGNWTCVAVGDLNKDGYTDFFFGRVDGPGMFALSDGKEKFKTVAAPAESAGARGVQFVDYDNDGLLDCIALTDKGALVLRNVGDGWVDTTKSTISAGLASKLTSGRSFSSADLDHDGDTDFIFGSFSGEIRVARNDGGNNNNSLRVNLTGKVSNRSGVGAKIEARAGSLVQKLETYSASPAPAQADVVFGLGKRTTAEAVRILWPAGIVQAETEIPAPQLASATAPKGPKVVVLPVTELDRKPSSCPFLYAWNGNSFEFVTDFMGGGEMGYLEEPGRYNKPDPEEYVRIRGDQLKERNGRLELRVTNELEEALFVDRLQLIAISHPADVEVYPNAGMSDPPRKFLLYKTKGAHVPLAAVDDQSRDVLDRISKLDRRYPDDFQRDAIRGYAKEHSLTLKLDNGVPANKRTLLLLTGWTDYAWSSDNVAATQAGKSMKAPELQVKDRNGNWKTVIEDIGIPVGRPQTVTVDLTGKFLSSSREVRIVTNMRVLWDQILVDTSNDESQIRMTRLDPMIADLRWRGFSREVTPDGREPMGYDYKQVSFSSPWKVIPGRYTREGDVRELVRNSDDMFVISRPGDELSLSFDAAKLPTLPAGWTRTFLLYADGYSKEMDINSASPDQVYPLPFHGMTKYPYGPSESYPLTAGRREYIEKYNTRVVRAPISTIEAALLQGANSSFK